MKNEQKSTQLIDKPKESIIVKENGRRVGQSEEKDKVETTTTHSDGRKEKKIFNFGNKKK